MNSEYCRKALEIVGNPNVLVNLISKRVRQLTSGGGAGSRPLVADAPGLGAADLALLEIIEGKMTWSRSEDVSLGALTAERVVKKKRRS